MAPKASRAVSFNPDEMSSGGLPTDFDGYIAEAVWCKFDYDGKADRPALAARFRIQAADGSGHEGELIEAHYSGGDLAFFVPSLDGENPVDLDDADAVHEGPFVVPVGERSQLSKSSNFADWIDRALKAGMPASLLGNDLTSLVGVSGHWNRVPQKTRTFSDKKGQKPPKEGERVKEILALTDFAGMVAAGGKTVGAAKKGAGAGAASTGNKPAATKGAPPAAEADDDLDGRIMVAVIGVLAETSPIKLQAVGPKIITQFATAEMTPALKRLQDPEFHEGKPWAYDAKKGTLATA